MTSKTTNGILSVLSGRVGVLLVGLLITPILVRLIGQGGYGDYAFILSLVSISSIFAHAGISGGIRKFIAEEREDDDWQEGVFAVYARLGLVLVVLVAGGFVAYSIFGAPESRFGDGYSVYLLLVAAMLLTEQFFYISRFTLMGLHLESRSEPLRIVRKLLFGLVGLPLAYVGFGVAGVLFGTAVASLVCAVWATKYLVSEIDVTSIVRPLPAGFPWQELIRFNVSNTAFILLTISLYNVDILLLRPTVGQDLTGLYKSALVVAEFVWIVPKAVQMIFVHSSSELWSQERYQEISQMASKATRLTFAFTGLMLLGIAALASEFVTMYFGSEFAGAEYPLLLLLPGILGFAIARPIYSIGQGKGEFRVLIYSTGCAALINLVLNVLLIPRYGVGGAAVSTSIGYGSMLLFHSFAARSIGFDPFQDFRALRIAATMIVVAPFVFGLSYVITSPVLSLVMVPPIGFLLYTTAGFRFQAIDPEEVRPVLEQSPGSLDKWSVKVIDVLS